MLGGLFGLVGSIHSIKALVDGDAEALSPIADGYFQWMATLMVAGLLAAIGSVLWGWPFEMIGLLLVGSYGVALGVIAPEWFAPSLHDGDIWLRLVRTGIRLFYVVIGLILVAGVLAT